MMEVYPAAAAFFLIWLWGVSRNSDNGIVVGIAALPFGMFAAVNASGFSLLLSNLLAMFTVMVLMLRYMSWQGPKPALRIPVSGIYLLVYALYSLFSAIILVRLFQGQFLVFPMNVSSTGIKVSWLFPSTMRPISPGNSNISQAFYILLSCGFFLAVVFVARRRGIQFIESGLVWAASINIALGVLDLLQLDTVLSAIRTADYTLANEQTLSGIARVIGGFSEPAAFGAFSAAFATYFTMSFLISGRRRDGVLGLLNLVFACLALSTTTFVGLAAAAVLVVLHSRTFLNAKLSRTSGHAFVICAALFVCALCLVVLFTPALEVSAGIFERLFLQKRDSLSGLERGAWTSAAVGAFFETWGLGAGVGSLRGSGLFSVLLGSVGLPGTAAFLAFLYFALGRAAGFSDPDTFKAFYASRVCALTILASYAVSATVPDPTLILVLFTAMAVVAREQSVARSENARFSNGPPEVTASS